MWVGTFPPCVEMRQQLEGMHSLLPMWAVVMKLRLLAASAANTFTLLASHYPTVFLFNNTKKLHCFMYITASGSKSAYFWNTDEVCIHA